MDLINERFWSKKMEILTSNSSLFSFNWVTSSVKTSTSDANFFSLSFSSGSIISSFRSDEKFRFAYGAENLKMDIEKNRLEGDGVGERCK